jgi:hypothetical protein
MKKIGFIDYYISEWHANNYPKWMDAYVKEAGLDYKVAYAYAEIEKSPVDGVTTDEWCEKFGVERINTIKELVEKSDYIIILAPSNPETHLRLCEEAFKYAKGKRMYIDKTFAPNYETACKIFELAKENDITCFSTSALRYSPDLINNLGEKNLATYYAGSNLVEYIIHQVESIVKFYGIGASKIKCEVDGEVHKFEVAYKDGRLGRINFKKDYADYIEVERHSGKIDTISLSGGFFTGLTKAIIDFFETGKIDFDVNEILEVMKIRDALLISKENIGKWIEI